MHGNDANVVSVKAASSLKPTPNHGKNYPNQFGQPSTSCHHVDKKSESLSDEHLDLDELFPKKSNNTKDISTESSKKQTGKENLKVKKKLTSRSNFISW